MGKELKNQFMQTGFLTTIWLVGIITITRGNEALDVQAVWHILGIAGIAALIFGVIYPYVWNYGTWGATVNVAVTTIANFIGGFGAVYLFSQEMFQMIKPYWWAMLLLNLVLHVAAFYLYRTVQNRKLADSLNRLSK